jgi:hypothetical protein
VRYLSGGKLLAAATVGRDLEALKLGQAMRDANDQRVGKGG